MNAVDEYIRLAESWGASMQDGDSDTANSLYDRIQQAFQRLCQMNQENELFDRADTTSDAACLFIASHLKERDQPRAIKLYQRLARSSEWFVAMSAQHILSEAAARGS
jgi:hypothetical protein